MLRFKEQFVGRTCALLCFHVLLSRTTYFDSCMSRCTRSTYLIILTYIYIYLCTHVHKLNQIDYPYRYWIGLPAYSKMEIWKNKFVGVLVYIHSKSKLYFKRIYNVCAFRIAQIRVESASFKFNLKLICNSIPFFE